MFTNTFKPQVIDQLTNRSIVNECLDVSSKNWFNRTPYIFAYSNLRYKESGSQDPLLYENMKWSVLSSFVVTGSNYTYENYILNDKNAFYDFYEQNQNFGIIPRPHITSLNVKGRGNNGTIKDVNMEIICYSFDQFVNIRKYFSVPCTSVFIQFGYFCNSEDLSAILVPPLVCGYGQINNNNQIRENSYLNMANIYKKFDKEQIVTSQALLCIVYGFDIDQQSGNIFKLTVNMMCQGNSEILNYIKPQSKINFKFLEAGVSTNLKEEKTTNNKKKNTQKDSKKRLKSGIPWEPGHKVIRAYGNQKHPTTGQYMTHNGIDIGLTTGDPLYAPYDCKIIAINQNINDPSGLYIVFQYQNGNSVRRVSYCHCDSIPGNLQVNNTYPAGTIMGYGGSTGNSTGAHLHITYRKDGNIIDPALGDIRGKVFSPSYTSSPSQENDGKTGLKQSYDSNISSPTPLPENTLINYIRGLSQRVNSGKHSIVLNTDGQRYVTFDWINYVIIYLLRKITISPTSSESGEANIPELFEPIYFFDLQKDFDKDACFYSNDLDIAILPPNNPFGYSFIYDDISELQENNKSSNATVKTLYSKINNLIKLYSDVLTFIEGNDFFNTYIKPNKFMNKIYDYYFENYITKVQSDGSITENGIISKSKTSGFGYLGHIYFRLEYVLQLLKSSEKITLDGFMTSLISKIISATNNGLVCSTSFNHRTKKFLVSEHSLIFSPANDTFYIPNFGAGSIVKQITYNLKMPDGYKATIMSGKSKTIMNELFKQMFGGESPEDLYIYKGISNSEENEQQFIKIVDYQKQLIDNKPIADTSFTKNGKLNCKELVKDSVKRAIDLCNQAIFEISKNKIRTLTGHQFVSSIYAIQLQIVLDFIANIDWGEVFKLEYNPLGWESKFYVSDIEFRIQPEFAETVIRGNMFV